MKRTSIYLGEAQSAALDEIARAQGLSRAEVIRASTDRGLNGAGPADLEADLIAIAGSFGTLRGDDEALLQRGPDDRAAHLNRAADL